MKKTIIIALTIILILTSFTSCENNTHEHTWDKGTVTKAATCTEKGVTTYTCTGCKKTITEEIEALGHKWNDGVETTKATYLKKGTLTKTCTRTDCKEIMNIDIPCIPLNGQSFAFYYYNQNEQNKSMVQIISLSDTDYDCYGGVDDQNKNVSATHGFGDGYSLIGSTLTLTIGENEVPYDLIEVLSDTGDVTSITMKNNNEMQSLVPIELKVEDKPEGHYYIEDKKVILPYTYTKDGKTINDTKDITSITIGPLEHEIETKPGYLTKGAYNCSVCGYKGDIPVIPLAGTKWTSTSVIETNNTLLSDINGKKLIIEFNNYPTATIYAKADSDSEPSLINSISSYDLELNENPKTISLIGGYNIQYKGSINEDINDETITITNFTMYLSSDKSVEIGTITFKQNKQ